MELDEYYSIDSILAEQTRIPCTALHEYNEETNLMGDGQAVSRNQRFELPYWIAKPLAQYTLPNTDDSSLISIELPKTFGTRVRNALDASPTNVDFTLLCPYFYLFGVKLLDLVVDDSLSMVLKEAFKERLRDIMNFSQTLGASVGQEFIQKLDETEREKQVRKARCNLEIGQIGLSIRSKRWISPQDPNDMPPERQWKLGHKYAGQSYCTIYET